MTVIECVGAGRARGQAHGEAARALVRAALERWRDATGRSGRTLVADTGLLAAVDANVPDLGAELRGIAEGAAVPFADIAAYNFMDEQWWFDREGAERGCSVLGVAGSGGPLLAQNMDLPAFMDGSQLVLRLRPPEEPEALVLTSAGLIGLTGVNRVGVAICVNALLMLRHDREGLPVSAVLRRALTCTTRADAVASLRTTRHASGQHYAIADSTGLEGIECSAAEAAVSSPFGARTLVHTNHPLVSGDIEAATEAMLEREGRIADSRARLTHLETHVDSVAEVADAERLLADRTLPLCITPGAGQATQTFGAVTFVPGHPARARFHLGPPDRGPWIEPNWSATTEREAQ